MKKTFLTSLATIVIASGALAQGTVNFNNSSASLVTYGEGANMGASVPADGTFFVELYWAVAGTTDVGAFVAIDANGIGSQTAGISPVAGRYSGGTRTTGLATGLSENAAFLVRAWSGVGGVGDWAGESGIFESATGGGGSPIADLPVALSATALPFTVSLVPVPEPSVIMLGIAGAGLLWFRRKK